MADEKGLSEERRKELEDKAAVKGLQALFKVSADFSFASGPYLPKLDLHRARNSKLNRWSEKCAIAF